MTARLVAIAAPLLVGVAFAAPASATFYCVHQTGSCPGGYTDAGGDLQAALDTAAAHDGSDSMLVYPGTYVGPFDYADPDHLDIIGFGSPKPVLTANSMSGGDSVLHSHGAFVTGVRVTLPAVDEIVGIKASEDAEIKGVEVEAPEGTEGSHGVWLTGTATLLGGTADVPGGSGASLRGSGHLVRNSRLSGTYGVHVQAAPPVTSTIQRSELTGTVPLRVINAHVFAENSVLRASGGDARGISAACNLGGSPTTYVGGDHLTILGSGTGIGLDAVCTGAGETAGMELKNSIVRGFAAAFHRSASAGGESDIAVTYSDVESTVSVSSGPGSATFADNIDVDPRLAGDGHRLRTGSPLIDAGDPAAAMQFLDFGHGLRTIGGRQDIGADEYDPDNPPPEPPPPPDGSGGDEPEAPGDTTPAGGDPAAPVPPFVPATAPSDADLLAELERTLKGRRGRAYRHRFLVPGTLVIRWRIRRRVVARATLTRSRAGDATLRVKSTKRGRRRIRRAKRVHVVGTFALPGRPALRVVVPLLRTGGRP